MARGDKAVPVEAPAERGPSKRAGSGPRKEPASKVAQRPEFLFGCGPGHWQVQLGKLVPALQPLALSAGLYGTKVAKDGTINARSLLSRKLDQGWTLLEDPYCTPDRQPYLHVVVNEDGQDVWLSRWETTVPGTDVVVSDEAGYVAWLEWLVAQGHVPPIATYVLDRLCSQVEKLAHEAGAQADHHPAFAALYERHKADLAVLTAAKAARHAGGARG